MKNSKLVNVILLFLSSIILFSCSEEKSINVDYSFKVAKDIPNGINDINKVRFYSVNHLNLGFYKGKLWLKLEIINPNSNKTLMFTNKDLFNRNYTFYKIHSDSNYPAVLEEIKSNTGYDGRTFNNPYPNFKINLSPNEKAIYLITSQSDGRITDATPELITIDAYNSKLNQHILWSIVFLGMVIFLIALNLYLWNLHKHPIYASHIFYMITSLFIYAGFDGYFYKLNLNQIFIDHSIFLAVRIWVISLIFFTAKFLDIKKISPQFYKYSMTILILILLGNSIYQFIFYSTSIQHLHYYENVLIFFYLLLIFSLVVVSFKYRRLELKYYLIALSFFLTFTIVGFIDGHFLIFPGDPFVYIKIGTLIEFIGFTYFMTILIKQKLSSNEKLQGELEEKRSLLQEKEQVLASNSSLVSVIKIIENSFSNESDWNDFQERFKTLDPYFVTALLAKNPSLTKSELRLLTLIRIGYSQKEIANILNITPDSVKKARNRVRKKLGLGEAEDLISYLQVLELSQSAEAK